MSLFFVVVLISSVFNIAHAVRPEIVDDILPEVKQRGQTAYLNCSVINLVSPAQLQWVKQTTPSGNPLHISSDETIRILDVVEGKRKYDINKIRANNREMYQLIIRSLTETDSGQYKCQIYLPNQNYLEWPTKLGNLTVQIAPTIKDTSSASITVQSGQNITLNCEAEGIPAPNITWKRGDGLALPDGSFQYRINKTEPFRLYNIEAEDRGQFICIADNNVKPPDSYTVQLEVRFRPITKAVQDTVGQAQNRRFHAKLDCLVAANPQAEVIWYKENKATREKEQINDNDKYTLNQQDDQRLKADEKWYSLQVMNVQGNDYGDYYCTGRNEYGTHEAKFVLFETMECQGLNCPSVNTGGTTSENMECQGQNCSSVNTGGTTSETTGMECQGQNCPFVNTGGTTSETMECQGQNCPSVNNGGKASGLHYSLTAILIGIFSSLVSRKLFGK